ncbi:MAG: hypothetical protein LBJ72_02000, partial [Dysgonamonadaceae bacterium]|nr:hypothetical protein [Dysgonamonadaceae bacterium]
MKIIVSKIFLIAFCIGIGSLAFAQGDEDYAVVVVNGKAEVVQRGKATIREYSIVEKDGKFGILLNDTET